LEKSLERWREVCVVHKHAVQLRLVHIHIVPDRRFPDGTIYLSLKRLLWVFEVHEHLASLKAADIAAKKVTKGHLCDKCTAR